MEKLIRQLIQELGDDPDRQALAKTPQRVRESLTYLTRGYRENIADIFQGAVYPEANRDMIVLKNIEVYSLCEHHILPFFDVRYVPLLPPPLP